MAIRRRSPFRALRSRRLAAALLAGLAAYSILTTAIPQSSFVTAAELTQWQASNPVPASIVGALGLHRAYWSPIFLIPAVLLLMSTALCAYDRTKAARVYSELSRRTPDRVRARLRSAPTFSFRLGEDGSVSSDKIVGDIVRSLGLRVDLGEGVVRARSRTAAAFGSAIFHWSLVGLFAVALIGQAAKWEGQIGIPVGHSVTDQTASYGLMARGPLAPAAPATGYTIAVPSMELEHIVDGIERGHAPAVELRDGDAVVAKGLVFPNSPLVHGGLYIHRSEWGLGMVAALETTAGVEVGRRNFLFDFATIAPDGHIIIETELPPEVGAPTVRFELPLDTRPDGRPISKLPDDARIELTAGGSSDTTRTVMRKGDVVSFPGGQLQLRVVDVTRYARLFVVHDPTIPFVYAFLVLAMLGGALALMVHPRVVLAQIRESEEGRILDVLVLVKRIDPLFAPRVREALSTLSAGEDVE